MARVDRSAVLFFMALGVVACLMPAQSDTWWQLRTGEEIWRTRSIMLHDEFTHTVEGQYWPNHEWLTQATFYAAWRAGGMPLLTAFCAAAVVAAWVLVFAITPGPPAQRLLLVGIGAALSTGGWSLRPQVLTLALFALTLSMLVRRRWLWLLPAVFLIWANLHGAVAAGGIVVAGAAFAAAIVLPAREAMRVAMVTLACFAATAFTPLGPSLWLEIPQSLQRLKIYDVIEWRAPALTNPGDAPFWIASGGLAVLAVARRQALRRYEPAVLAIASALTLALALRSGRNTALFYMCAAPLAGMLLSAARNGPAGTVMIGRRTGAPAVGTAVLGGAFAAAAAFVAYAWTAPLARLQWDPMSAEMKAAIAGCEGPLYNRYDEGGYIIWFLKGRQAFIDSRQDPFPESLVLEQLRVEDTGDYRSTFNRFGITCALTFDGSKLSRRLAADGWQARPAGAGWKVFSRPPSTSSEKAEAA